MSKCGNVKHTPGGRVLKRCEKQAGEGSMFCDECKAAALERVKAFIRAQQAEAVKS